MIDKKIVPDSHADEATLFASLPWPGAAVSPDGRILAANPGFLAHFPHTVPGHSLLDDLFAPDGNGARHHAGC